VRPYVVRNKTDRTDAKGLLEAARNDEVRPVPVKSETQQALTALHRLRSTWLATRTARINTVRGLLREFRGRPPHRRASRRADPRAVLEDADGRRAQPAPPGPRRGRRKSGRSKGGSAPSNTSWTPSPSRRRS